MTDFDDDEGAVFLEPIKTGGLKVVLATDSELAQEYIVEAKKFLGAVKSQHAVNAHTRNSFSAPYIFQSKILPDGTVIKVTSEPALDTIRIEPVVLKEEDTKPPEFEPSEYHFDADADVGGAPYLWVGIRYIEGGVPINTDYAKERWSKSHLCVWEPLEDTQTIFNIVSNRDYLVHGLEQYSESVYPLRPNNSDNLNVEINYTDRTGVTWDVIIWAEKPRLGKYFAKAMMVGPDCYRTTPTKVELRVVVGKESDKPIGIEAVGGTERFRDVVEIKEMTSYLRGILPMGWFNPDNLREPARECSRKAPDYGVNPHASHWWQDCIEMTVADHNMRRFRLEINGLVSEYADAGGVSSAVRSSYLPTPGFEKDRFPDKSEICTVCEYDTTHNYRITRAADIDSYVEASFYHPQCLGVDTFDFPLYIRWWVYEKTSILDPFKYLYPEGFNQLKSVDVESDESGYVLTVEIIPRDTLIEPETEPTRSGAELGYRTLNCTTGGYVLGSLNPTDRLILYEADRHAWDVQVIGYHGSETFIGGILVTKSVVVNGDHTGFETRWSAVTSYKGSSRTLGFTDWEYDASIGWFFRRFNDRSSWIVI